MSKAIYLIRLLLNARPIQSVCVVPTTADRLNEIESNLCKLQRIVQLQQNDALAATNLPDLTPEQDSRVGDIIGHLIGAKKELADLQENTHV